MVLSSFMYLRNQGQALAVEGELPHKVFAAFSRI